MQENIDALLLVMTTVSSEDDARRIASALVEQHLVACAQISPVESIYRWQDQLQQEKEWRLVLKTNASLYAAVELALLNMHPYDLPAIYSVPVTNALEPYADWVREQLP